jgi:hypothetical protein
MPAGGGKGKFGGSPGMPGIFGGRSVHSQRGGSSYVRHTVTYGLAFPSQTVAEAYHDLLDQEEIQRVEVGIHQAYPSDCSAKDC